MTQIGDLLFSRWNGWDDRLILCVQWFHAHVWDRSMLPYWRWTHVQVRGNPGELYEASWPVVCKTTDAENVYSNGLRAITEVQVPVLDRNAVIKRCQMYLNLKYSLVRFFCIGLKLLTYLKLPFDRFGLVCSTYASRCLHDFGDRWISPMELAKWANCPYKPEYRVTK